MRVVFVHGACVSDGAWWWRHTGALLATAGITSVCPALPSCGEGDRPSGADGPGYADDVAAVRAVLTDSDEPTVVVAHSYGGIVVAEAAADVSAVRHLVAIASYLPEPGESLASFAGEEPAPYLHVDPAAGTLAVRPDQFVDVFLHDCRDEATAASERLAAQTLSIVASPVRVSAWQQLPSTYLVCRHDRGTPAARQRVFAARATHVHELDTGHHPFLASPAAVADVLLALA